MGKFFTAQTQCLYLDQFAVSRICVPSPPAEWTDISTLIKQGVHEGKLICPNSIEQMIETVGMDKESAKSLDKEARKLSSGWCFSTESDISARYLICRLRNRKMTKRHFIHRKPQQHVDEPEVYEELGERRATFTKMIEDAAHTVNIIRTAAREGRRGKKDMRDILINIIKDKYAQELKARMLLLGIQGNYSPRTVTLAGHTILFWADVVCHTLVNKHLMTQQEALDAFELLQSEGIDAIPSLSIRTSLEAMLAYKRVNETHNHHVDIMRIAVALPFADIMLIDGPKASDVRELGLDKKYQTAIYSGKRADLAMLKEQLDTLINQ